MYGLSRVFLILALMYYLYALVLLAVLLTPWSWYVLGGIGLMIVVKERRNLPVYTSHGWAAWETESGLRKARMAEGRGLILGRLYGARCRPSIRALFNWTLGARDACWMFFAKKRKAPVITMPPHVVHTSVFAPAGAGKSTGLVIPFLLRCPDSAVVIDLKGELALATAEARWRMGHEIVVLDPYGVVTQ